MEDQNNNPRRSTDARVEHITVPDGDGFIRWNIINRGSDANGHEAGHDTDGGGADLAGTGALSGALDWVKRKLAFWR